jgi:hypothetical protein
MKILLLSILALIVHAFAQNVLTRTLSDENLLRPQLGRLSAIQSAFRQAEQEKFNKQPPCDRCQFYAESDKRIECNQNCREL